MDRLSESVIKTATVSAGTAVTTEPITITINTADIKTKEELEKEIISLKEALETEAIYSEYWKAQAMRTFELVQTLKEKNAKLHEALKGGASE